MHYQHAMEMILQGIEPLAPEPLPVLSAAGRILAAALVAPHDMPPFAQSMVDGYALRSRDTKTATTASPTRLALGPTLTAGEVLARPLARHQAIRIMTGAPMPRGADTVLKMEESTLETEALVIQQPRPAQQGVQQRGAEIRRHTAVLPQGARLTPERIGVALSLGVTSVPVVRRPRLALVAPGDELLPPGAPWQAGKKWCSNLYALELRAQDVGCDIQQLGIVPDTLESLTEHLRRGLAGEVIVILGASGRGDHDYATRAMVAAGADILFRGVATSPGRSVTVARHGQTLLFGLPGSPWAAFVGFEVFVLPALRALLGQRPACPPTHAVALGEPLHVRPGMTHFVPARVQPHATGPQAFPLQNLLALARAGASPVGLIIVPPHRRRVMRGARVRLQPLTLGE